MNVKEHIMLHATSGVHNCKEYIDKLTLIEQWYAGWCDIPTNPNSTLAVGARSLSAAVFNHLFGYVPDLDDWNACNDLLNTATEDKLSQISSDIGFIKFIVGGTGVSQDSCKCPELIAIDPNDIDIAFNATN